MFMNNLPLEEVYVFLLERTARQFKKHATQVLKANDIHLTSERWVILKRISENKGINQREVAKLTYKDPASVTRILDSLEKQGLILRKKNDRRSFALETTEQGEAWIAKVLPVANMIREKGMEGISSEELIIFKKVLNKIYQNFS